MSRKFESSVIGRGGRYMNVIAEISLITLTCSHRRDQNFLSTRRTPCQESWNQVFLVSASQNQLNMCYLVLIIDIKIFMTTMYIFDSWNRTLSSRGSRNEPNVC